MDLTFQKKWHNLDVEEALRLLGSDRSGLSEVSARERLKQYGSNELPEKAKTPWPIVFLRQFASPLIYILLIAAAAEIILLKKPADATVILVVVLINSIIGFLQEHKAETSHGGLETSDRPPGQSMEAGGGRPGSPRATWSPETSSSWKQETGFLQMAGW